MSSDTYISAQETNLFATYSADSNQSILLNKFHLNFCSSISNLTMKFIANQEIQEELEGCLSN